MSLVSSHCSVLVVVSSTDRSFKDIYALDVIQSHSGQNITSKLVQASLEFLDQADQDAFFVTTKRMQHVFEHLGFETIKAVELMEGYVEIAMYRKARKAEVKGRPHYTP